MSHSFRLQRPPMVILAGTFHLSEARVLSGRSSMIVRRTVLGRIFSSGFAAAALLMVLPAGASAQDPVHSWTGGADPAALETWVNARLAAAKADIDKVTAVKGDHTLANTVRPYDDAQNELVLAGYQAYLMYAVGDAAPLRDKGQALVAKVSSVQTELSLNQAVYKALAAVPIPANDPATKHYIERPLLEYRLAGVDKDDDTH